MGGNDDVAPLAGAWIETIRLIHVRKHETVAPLAGAWIETAVNSFAMIVVRVAPLAGAWIETLAIVAYDGNDSRRAPRGRVD